MSEQYDQVYQAAMELSEAERELLVDLLIGSLESDRPVLDEAWMQEIRRRSAEIEEGKAELIPWEIVSERVRRIQVIRHRDPDRSTDNP
jgi:putative addiction module component (TIGR02574 family)